MSRKAIILAKGGKGGDVGCRWKRCEKQHEFKIKYPNDGVVVRKGLSQWSHPSVYSQKKIFMPEFQKKAADPSDLKRAGAYKYQRHHIIPCAVFKKFKNTISYNLKLIGFDINNEMLNGISLPTKPKDIVWHDLQYHRGFHKTYNDIVHNALSNLEETVLKLCTNDEQGKLWDEIEKKVEHFKKKILKWQIELYPDSFAQREAQFKKIGITVP